MNPRSDRYDTREGLDPHQNPSGFMSSAPPDANQAPTGSGDSAPTQSPDDSQQGAIHQAPMTVKVFDKGNLEYTAEFQGNAILGRQQMGEPEPYCEVPSDEGLRVIMANLRERMISRFHIRLQQQVAGQVLITNRSERGPVLLDGSTRLGPCESRLVTPPALIVFGHQKAVRIEPSFCEPDVSLESLAIATQPPGGSLAHSLLGDWLAPDVAGAAQIQIRGIQAAIEVLQSAANSPDFLPKAARAAAEQVDLDSAAVLRYSGGNWRTDAYYPPRDDLQRWMPSRTMLERVSSEKRTFRMTPNRKAEESGSLQGVTAVVTAPILDQQGQVIGALYGDRRYTSARGGEISEMEARFFELLASGVAAGLSRLEQEQAALKARVQFEQFFTVELAEELEVNPRLLDGRNENVTVLFADIVGFSKISQNLEPERTVAWINHVMETLSECVLAHRGVLVDYIGDELLAMWGAPKPQSNHAVLACRAAIEMVKRLPVLNSKWQDELGAATDLSIGINSGVARVGNIGSSRKFKYGPLGNEVNLASRVCGATKSVKARVLVTDATAKLLGPNNGGEFFMRRLCRVRVRNISEPVALFELDPDGGPSWSRRKEKYEAALEALEGEDFLTAARTLGNLLEEEPDDGPTLLALSRAVQALATPEEFDPVVNLVKK